MFLTKVNARAVSLAAQGLLRPTSKRAAKNEVLRAIRRMGALQIDSINVVARSPYLVLWSRLGPYNPVWLDQLLAEGKLFEYWSHEASFIPIEDYPLYRNRMLDPESMGWKYRKAWVDSHRLEVAALREQIRLHGPVRSADFQRTDGKRTGWWGWKVEKQALEALFTAGELMIAKRENFQRVYNLRERILPSWDDSRLMPVEKVRHQLALKAVRALGVAKSRWVSDYFRSPKRETLHALSELVETAALVPVEVEGWKEPGYVHPDNRGLLKKAVSGELTPELTTLLSPFDPLIWDRERLRVMFDFNYTIECYTPTSRRNYGYYVLPILHRGSLVGRLDAKAHRKEGVFEVKSLYMESNVRADAQMLECISATLRDCALWHKTPRVQVRTSTPASFAKAIRRTLKDN